jgi:2-isopropylmalate synthase
MGYQYTRNQIDELYPKFVAIADKKKEVLEADLKEMAEAYN